MQGANGALVVNNLTREYIDCVVGSQSSQINIRDRRKATVKIIERIMLDGHDDFADTFNKPAHIHVSECENIITIVLSDTDAEPEAPTLWLGVIYGCDSKMAVYSTAWEYLRAIENDEIAFASLIIEEVGE